MLMTMLYSIINCTCCYFKINNIDNNTYCQKYIDIFLQIINLLAMYIVRYSIEKKTPYIQFIRLRIAFTLTLWQRIYNKITEDILWKSHTNIYIECSRLMLLSCFSKKETRQKFYQTYIQRRKTALVTRYGVEWQSWIWLIARLKALQLRH